MWIHMQLNWNRSSARRLRVSLCSEVNARHKNTKIHHLTQTRRIKEVDVPPHPRFLKAFPILPLPKQIKSSLFALHSRKRSKPACKLIQSGHVLFRSSRGLSGTHRNQVWMVGTTLVFTMPTSFTSRKRHTFCLSTLQFCQQSCLSACNN